MLKEFKAFAMQGNMVDLAIGVIIGTAFGAIVASLVADVLMPPLGLAMGGIDFSNMHAVLKAGNPPPPYPTLQAATDAGAVTLNYGKFINEIIRFVIVALCLFFVVKAMNRMKKPEKAAATTMSCPQCLMDIPIGAHKCGHCGSAI
ncbi:MAG TPA: large-conductance mechanosensitive channel protein MscL [Fimbriimonadales bacterium]|nr:large-conductance mechanosensitive channel protein MscL [Fimbriimonadales bacterium]